jgi:hypothetical protein
VTLYELNELCREIAEETATERMNEYIGELEFETDERMLAVLGPRAFGPDIDDEGANDCDGAWYWEK